MGFFAALAGFFVSAATAAAPYIAAGATIYGATQAGKGGPSRKPISPGATKVSEPGVAAAEADLRRRMRRAGSREKSQVTTPGLLDLSAPTARPGLRRTVG